MKRLTDIFGLTKTKVNNDIYTGIVTEDGVVKSSFMDETSMSFTLCAYIKNDSDIIEDEIYVTKEIRSINTKVKGIEPLTIVQISGEEFTHHDQKRIRLNKVLKSNVDNDRLERIRAKRKEPVIYESATLGKFVLDRRLDWYEGKTDWNGKLIDVFLSGELDKLDDTEQNAVLILQNQQDWDNFIKEKICKELLTLKNDSWLEEDEKPLTADEFISKIYLESITINNTDDFQMCFNDGDIFWGHVITVETDLKKNIEDIGIAG